MFLTRANSLRSKSPLRGRPRKNEDGLKVAEVDGISVLSNTGSHRNENEKNSNSGSSSSSNASLPADEREHQSDGKDSGPCGPRSPRLNKLRGKNSFMSFDSQYTSRHRKNKRDANSKKDNFRRVGRGLPLVENSLEDTGGGDVADSDSSDGIILPAITVPRNYNGGTMMAPSDSIESSGATISFPEIVKICIDSPSEEEHSLKLPTSPPPTGATDSPFNGTVV